MPTKEPNDSAIAVVKGIKSSIEPPPPAHPDWKPRLKRVLYVEESTKPNLGTTFVCWGRAELKIGVGGTYAFGLYIEQGNQIKFVNVITAMLMNGTPVYPDAPSATSTPPAPPPGPATLSAPQLPLSASLPTNGKPDPRSRAIARSVALKEVNALMIANKRQDALLAWGTEASGVEGTKELLLKFTNWIENESL